MNSLKQSIFDWYRQNEKELKKSHASAFINCNKGTITLKYPDGFTWELRAEDFPMRNGEYGQDAIPGPSHKRLEGAVFQGQQTRESREIKIISQ